MLFIQSSILSRVHNQSNDRRASAAIAADEKAAPWHVKAMVIHALDENISRTRCNLTETVSRVSFNNVTTGVSRNNRFVQKQVEP